MKVSIVIPSWNNEKLLQTNLKHIYKSAKQVNAEVILIDDASTDKSWKIIQQQTKHDFVSIERNNRNIGFARNVNKGVLKAKGKIVVLFNTDVKPNENCIQNSLHHFKNKDTFAVSFNSGDGWAGGKWEKGLFHHYLIPSSNTTETQISLWASGGQAAFDKKKWNKLGGFDPIYSPYYWEDTDLGYRAWKMGWKTIWEPKCKVVHDHKQSVISINKSKNDILQTAMRNQILFTWKNIQDKEMIRNHIFSIPKLLLTHPKPLLSAVLKAPQLKRVKNTLRTDKEILSQWE